MRTTPINDVFQCCLIEKIHVDHFLHSPCSENAYQSKLIYFAVHSFIHTHIHLSCRSSSISMFLYNLLIDACLRLCFSSKGEVNHSFSPPFLLLLFQFFSLYSPFIHSINSLVGKIKKQEIRFSHS